MTDPDGWIGFDFDGTLNRYYGWNDGQVSYDPILPMVERAKEYLTAGYEIRIVTARVAPDSGAGALAFIEYQRRQIEDWAREFLGQWVQVTSHKDRRMILLFDDRARQVIPNTGEIVGGGGYV